MENMNNGLTNEVGTSNATVGNAGSNTSVGNFIKTIALASITYKIVDKTVDGFYSLARMGVNKSIDWRRSRAQKKKKSKEEPNKNED